jgi:AcrR family transcriptional regulator
VDCTIGLLLETPPAQLTTRTIGSAVGLDPQVIFRNFGSLKGLYIAVIHELDRRVAAFIAQHPAALALPDVPAESLLRHQLALWLAFNGVDPGSIAVDPHLVEHHRRLHLRGLGVNGDAAPRAARTLTALAIAWSHATMLVGSLHPDLYDEASMADSQALLRAVAERLPELEQELGWETQDAS